MTKRLTAVSGFDQKGPAAFLAEIGDARLLLDIGEGPDEGRRPDLSGIGPVDAILLSHGHPDHVGALDLRGEVGDPPVFATELMCRIAGSTLPDTTRPLPLKGQTEIAGIRIETGTAGHAPGAVWMRLGGEEGLLYTGDCSAESTLFAHTMPSRAAALVFDASYGTYDEPLETAAAKLLSLAKEPLLLAAPAGGRGLEMALRFFEAGIDVALCPAHRHVAAVLLSGGHLDPAPSARLSALVAGSRPLEASSPAKGVMIAAKPNAQGGVAEPLARRFAASGEAAVVFTGHLAVGTPARALVQEGRARFLRWNVHPRLSEIRALFDAVQPRIAMPAFVGRAGREALTDALPLVDLVDRPSMSW